MEIELLCGFVIVTITLLVLEIFKKSPVSNMGFLALVIVMLIATSAFALENQHLFFLAKKTGDVGLLVFGREAGNVGMTFMAATVLYVVAFCASNERAFNREIQPMLDYIRHVDGLKLLAAMRQRNWGNGSMPSA